MSHVPLLMLTEWSAALSQSSVVRGTSAGSSGPTMDMIRHLG